VYTDYPHYPVWNAKIYQMIAKRGIATVAHLRGDWWTEFHSWIADAKMTDRMFALHRYYFTYMALALADVVTPICSALNKVVLEHFPSKRTHVVHQGVDPNMFFQEHGMSLEHPNVCIIQNHTILPKVEGLMHFAEVVKEMPEVHFYISGGQPITQPYATYVQQRFAPFPNVHMLGPVSYPVGLRQLLSEADLYVLASGLDMCPTTVLEAALMHRPVVASKVGGVPEIVLEGRTGYTIANADVDR
jgi:glycosyltransferase involved in cell wall biosynthesis